MRGESDVEGKVKPGRIGAGLRPLLVLPTARVAEPPTGLGVLKAMVPACTLEIAPDLRYARHRSRCRSGLATGEHQDHGHGGQCFEGGWQRGRHQATYCARPGTRTGAGVVSDESKRCLTGKPLW